MSSRRAEAVPAADESTSLETPGERVSRGRWSRQDPHALAVPERSNDGASHKTHGLEDGSHCVRTSINPTQYYAWKKQLLSSATKVFADVRESKPSAKEQRMESELRRAKDVIAEIVDENLDLRKGHSAGAKANAAAGSSNARDVSDHFSCLASSGGKECCLRMASRSKPAGTSSSWFDSMSASVFG